MHLLRKERTNLDGVRDEEEEPEEENDSVWNPRASMLQVLNRGDCA